MTGMSDDRSRELGDGSRFVNVMRAKSFPESKP